MVSLVFHNGWKGGEFNVFLLNVAHDNGVWACAAGLFGFGIALLVE